MDGGRRDQPLRSQQNEWHEWNVIMYQEQRAVCAAILACKSARLAPPPASYQFCFCVSRRRRSSLLLFFFFFVFFFSLHFYQSASFRRRKRADWEEFASRRRARRIASLGEASRTALVWWRGENSNLARDIRYWISRPLALRPNSDSISDANSWLRPAGPNNSSSLTFSL